MSCDPTREEVDHLAGPLLLEFGANWCPHCQAIRSVLSEMLRQHSQVRHIPVEDGPGQTLGRSYHVKLWPTLVFQRNGQVLRQLTRPSDEAIRAAFAELVQ